MPLQEEKIPDFNSNEKKLLVLDTSYTLEDIIKRQLLNSVTCRDVNGYFKHVWTVHPVATLVTSQEWTKKFGKPVWHSIAPAHTFIEGKMGRYAWLKWIPPLNFTLAQISLIFTLKQLIKKEGITVIRAGDILYLGLFGWVLSKICRIPFLVRVGGNNDKVFETTGKPMQKKLFFNRKIEKKVERFVLSRAHLVAGANQDNLEFALANGAPKENSTIFRYGNLLHECHFIEPGLRKDGTGLLIELNIQPHAFILYIGRLEKVKHPDHVIQALADVRGKGYNIKALLVGNGTLLPELKAMAEKAGVIDHVVFAGNRNQEWLSGIIPLASVVLSPHTGRALSEAALGSVPIVAYDIDWQSELIENEVTGLLVPYPNQSAFSEACERCLKDAEWADKMAKAVRKKAMDMLDPEKLNQHEINQYDLLFKRYYQ